MEIKIKGLTSEEELFGVIELQSKNLKKNLSSIQICNQGYLTFECDVELLSKINSITTSIVAKDGAKVIGYCILLTPEYRDLVPLFKTMYSIVDRMIYENKLITDHKYIINCQACLTEGYRGIGLLSRIYDELHKNYLGSYDLMIGEIASANIQSYNAHKKRGFDFLESYVDSDENWKIFVWNLNKHLRYS